MYILSFFQASYCYEHSKEWFLYGHIIKSPNTLLKAGLSLASNEIFKRLFNTLKMPSSLLMKKYRTLLLKEVKFSYDWEFKNLIQNPSESY